MTEPSQLVVAPEEPLALPEDGLFRGLRSSPSGLTQEEAERRLRQFGPNSLAKRKKRAAIVRFLFYFRSPLIIILILAGAVSTFFRELSSAAIIFVIVFISVILGFYQESKAESAAELLRDKVPTTATVLRDCVKREVRIADIVPGDVVQLSAGDIVPADSRIISAKDLLVDQSSLTGESYPAEKGAFPVSSVGAVTERPDCVFLGTSVLGGLATAIVVKTGGSTEYGKIAGKLAAKEPETEFERGLRKFGYLITQVTFLLVIFVFFVNALLKRDVLQSLLFAVALAVGITPELLPLIVSVNLSKGAIAMSKKGVIVKRLASIQNFGSMDILCTDKTGTLTENKITLFSYTDHNGEVNEKILEYAFLNSFYQSGLKSPLDEAILQGKKLTVGEYTKVDEIPFDFNRKRVSIVVDGGGQRLLITKGAPEEILRVCSLCEIEGKVLNLNRNDRVAIDKRFQQLSSDGLRVLGVAYKAVENAEAYGAQDEFEMTFLGLIAFTDPPKATARESLELLRRANVSLKILTGDSDLVTVNVCEQLGLTVRGVVLGSQLSELRGDALARVVEEANIFARVTPGQKDRIMAALRDNGHVVGFLGDGINDAASIKTADVGISVDNAVDVAKESADIILLQKDLTVLQQGVLEGRKTFGNTMKYVMMGTSSNFGNMFSAAGASLFLPFLPMLPEQILLNNLLYDFSELAIPIDNVDREFIEKPRRWDVSFVRNFMLFFGPISSLFDFLTFFVMLLVFNASEPLFQTGWFLESLSTQTLVIFIIRTRRIPFYKSRPSTTLLLSSFGAVIFAIALPFSPLAGFLKLVAPPPAFLIVLALFAGAYLSLAEVLKKVFYGRLEKRNTRPAGPILRA
ncbi:magnesium-translocating P-type ATPase [Candidatus Bathyarchaeota archaeon]|nr:MAG: magnesium-translocating P-type ATPase [Candidatus Bathyarchaeota archaeon]